jgi:hypothetical protein
MTDTRRGKGAARGDIRPTDADDRTTDHTWVDPELSQEHRGQGDRPDDPADPPTRHLGLDPELGPPPEGYGGEPGETDYDAPDSERTTGEVVDSES